MKSTERSHRRSSRRAGPGISLFPFLAVLICTMGALVPLLLAISRTAKLQAEAAAVAKMSQQSGKIKTQREDIRWRIGQLKQARTQTESQLAEARLELGHLEDHSRRLRDTLAQYQKTAADLESVENADVHQLTQSKTELEQVRSQIGAAQRQLAETHQSAGQNRSYAVVPFEGPNQTHRRPIYLECRAEAVVLQPEGIALTESDFEGPLGPGNPLAAALRAAREHMLARREFDPKAGEPYPLLLVRPEGIMAYYAARAAMKSWGFDFGYELVDDDWKLAYPPPDTQLADVVRRAIASARVVQARLIAAAPRHYGNRSKVVYRASPSSGGGLIRERGSSDDDGYAPADAAGPIGSGNGSYGGGYRGQGVGGGSYSGGYGGQSGDGGSYSGGDAGQGTGSSGGTGSALAATGGQGGGAAGNPYLAITGGQGSAAGGAMDGAGGGVAGGAVGGALGSAAGGAVGGTGGGAAGGDTGFAGPALAGSGGGTVGNPYRQTTEGARAGVPGSPMGQPANSGMFGSDIPGGTTSGNSTAGMTGNATGGATTTERPEGYIVGQPPRDSTTPRASSEPPPDDAPRGYALRPGEWQPTPEPPPKRFDEKKDKDREYDKHDKRPKKSLVEKRGIDWALRDASRNSTGVTRPIRVECHPDRLVIVSDRGPGANRVIPLGPRTRSLVDPLISGIWEQMDSWGMAGRGMYWRPVLQFHVAPGGEDRFVELSSLLQGSGLMVERK